MKKLFFLLLGISFLVSAAPVPPARTADPWEKFDLLAVRYPQEGKKIRELFKKDRAAAVTVLMALDRKERERRRSARQELRDLGKEAKNDPNSLPFLKEKLKKVYQEAQEFRKQYHVYMEQELKKCREADISPSAVSRMENRFKKTSLALEKLTGPSQEEFIRQQTEKLTAPKKSRKKKVE